MFAEICEALAYVIFMGGIALFGFIAIGSAGAKQLNKNCKKEGNKNGLRNL